jgi:dienelactone hydrolase
MSKNMHTVLMLQFEVPDARLVDEPEVGTISGLVGPTVAITCDVVLDGNRFVYEGELPVEAGSCSIPASVITRARRVEGLADSAVTPAAPLRGTLAANGLQQAFERSFRAPGVTVEVLDEPLAGRLYLPPGDGVHGALILLSGSGGGANDKEAALLASRGFACLALAYFNYPGRPDVLVDIDLEYFDTAYAWLARHPRVDGRRVALKGGSRGGELVLQLASMFAWPAAAIAVVPGAHRWGGVSPEGDQTCAWRWQGAPLPFVPADETDAKAAETAHDGSVVYAPVFDHALARCDPQVLAGARIPVEDISCPVLLVSGEGDAMWRCSAFAAQVYEALELAHPRVEHRNLVLPDAGHMLFPVGVPVETVLVHPVLPARFALGGSVEGTERGRVTAWNECLGFLRRTLPGGQDA